MSKSVSIVISAFNEENNVEKLYTELTKVLSCNTNIQFEFIYVDDGSNDKTYDKCLELQKKDTRIHLIKLIRNFGHEIAMTAGMDYAHGDAVIFMDCDLQHPPKYIPEMIRLWQEGNDIVLTKRIKNEDSSLIYKLFSKFFYTLLNKISDTTIMSNTPDFRLLDKKYVNLLKQFNERERLFRGLLSWIGPTKRIATIPFIAPARFSGKSKYNTYKSIKLALNSILQFSILPLKLATCFGAIAVLFAGILGIWILIEYLAFNKQPPGYASTMLVIIFLGSIQLMCLGIIGEYVGKIHIEVKKRPLYLIEPDTDTNKNSTRGNSCS